MAYYNNSLDIRQAILFHHSCSYYQLLATTVLHTFYIINQSKLPASDVRPYHAHKLEE
jgi:hypothetical protein